MARHKYTSKPPTSSFHLAIAAAFFSVLGYFGVSYITQSSIPMIADVTPYDNSQKNIDASSTVDGVKQWNAPTTESQQTSFKEANQIVIEQEEHKTEVIEKHIIDTYNADKDGASDALKNVASKLIAEEKEESSVDCSVKCATIGSPVCSGAYVFTGAGWKDGARSGDANSGGRECIQCGGNGLYDGESRSSCEELISKHKPVIIPSSVDPASIGLPAYDAEGKPLKITSCVEKQGGGWVLSPFGHKGVSGDICGIGGGWQDEAEFNKAMNAICGDEDTSYCNSRQNSSIDLTSGGEAEKSPEEVEEDKLKEQVDRCNDIVQKYNRAGADRWIKCGDSSIEGSVLSYAFCPGGTFDKNGVCSILVKSVGENEPDNSETTTTFLSESAANRLGLDCDKFSYRGVDGNLVKYCEYNDETETNNQPNTTFDSSDFTPPGHRASLPSECAWGYNDDDFDKLTCAERDDENAHHTDDQIARVKGHDSLADEDQQNDLTATLTSGDFYDGSELSMAYIDSEDDPSPITIFTPPGEQAASNDRDNCEFGYTWEWLTFQRICTNQGVQARRTSEQEMRNDDEQPPVLEKPNEPIAVPEISTELAAIGNKCSFDGNCQVGLDCRTQLERGTYVRECRQPKASPGESCFWDYECGSGLDCRTESERGTYVRECRQPK